jgi:predicted nucleic acid-binding protein
MSLPGTPEFKIVISDTRCRIILEKLNALSLLHQLYPQVITTPQVQHEFGADLPDWITIQVPQDTALVEAFKESVDPGEASAIALAIEIDNAMLIIDDRKGRILAGRMELPFVGSMGLLLKAKEHGLIPLIRPYIDRTLQTDFRISKILIEYVLQQAGE